MSTTSSSSTPATNTAEPAAQPINNNNNNNNNIHSKEKLMSTYLQRDKKYAEIYGIHRHNKHLVLQEFMDGVVKPIEQNNHWILQLRQRQNQLHLQQNKRKKLEFQIIDSRNPILDNPEENPPIQFLVPIRIDVEISASASTGNSDQLQAQGQQQVKFKDTFTWNLYESQLTPATFTSILLSDLKLSQAFQKPIEDQIQSQLLDFKRFIPLITQQDTSTDLRVLIKISVSAACVTLDDSMETNLSQLLDSDTPEHVATCLCNDLGLGGEFLTAAAHLIREQAYLYLKTFVLTGDSLFLPDLQKTIRDSEKERLEFTPTLNILSQEEQERMDKLNERESRRKRRATTRGRKRNNAQTDIFGFTLVMEDDFGRGVQCLATPDFSEPFGTNRSFSTGSGHVQLFTYSR